MYSPGLALIHPAMSYIYTLPYIIAGYANEVGEAFRNMVHLRFVYLSYAISSGYVISHAIARGWSTRKKPDTLRSGSAPDRIKSAHSDLQNTSSSTQHSFTSLSTGRPNQFLPTGGSLSTHAGHVSPKAAVLDTLLWQGLASVVIPGLTINRLCAGSRLLLNRCTTQILSQQVRRWMVTGVGLSSIPMIIHPIDW